MIAISSLWYFKRRVSDQTKKNVATTLFAGAPGGGEEAGGGGGVRGEGGGQGEGGQEGAGHTGQGPQQA